MSVSEAVSGGSRALGLKALRDRLARTIDECDSARDLAALSRQLTDVLAQLDEVDPPAVERNPLDELASRREGRSAS